MEGYKIVLTSDRTLMSEYGGAVFMGFSACIPKGVIPDWVYFNIFCPSVKVDRSGSPLYASYGLRKIEAALLDYGFGEDEVAVAHPDYIDRFVGDSTRVIGVSENDPLGIGPATTTFTEILGGEAYMAIKFRELLSNQSIARYRRNIRVIVGGPGAWQLEDGETRSKLGIDCVVIGEGEKVVGPLFEKAARGEEIPSIVYGDIVDVDEMPIIRRPAVCGLVEISRGCGSGFAYHVLERSIDKGVGLKVAVDLMNVRVEDVVAVGDSENDIPMFRVVGFSIAVGDASEDVKRNASLTVNGSNGEGFAEAAKLILRMKEG